MSSYDSYQIKVLKLDILSTIATESSVPFILEEFQVLSLFNITIKQTQGSCDHRRIFTHCFHHISVFV